MQPSAGKRQSSGAWLNSDASEGSGGTNIPAVTNRLAQPGDLCTRRTSADYAARRARLLPVSRAAQREEFESTHLSLAIIIKTESWRRSPMQHGLGSTIRKQLLRPEEFERHLRASPRR